jgi:predicted GIY-YIG superfamily endonuclease
MDKVGYVYIMANRKNGTIDIGVTSDLAKRAYEHREGLVAGFTKNTAASAWSGLKRSTTFSRRGTASCR